MQEMSKKSYLEWEHLEGGEVINTVGDWLTSEELAQLDIWLYQRVPLYIDQNYLDGNGTQALSEAEQAETNLWAIDRGQVVVKYADRGHFLQPTAQSLDQSCHWPG